MVAEIQKFGRVYISLIQISEFREEQLARHVFAGGIAKQN